MERSYTEAFVKIKTSIGVFLIKAGIILLTAFLLLLAFNGYRYTMIAGVVLGALLIWYWPRFVREWEYVFCDGKMDFAQIRGKESRKDIMSIELESADVCAPIDHHALDGYRHLEALDFTSQKAGTRVYGVATRLPNQEKKVVIKFEPSDKMIELMKAKCPNIVKD
ncbi:MAG: hypothetical protein K6G62_08510 [Eubacterium sp.]|nr:hypothetical protein [Eubacterium sp.]